MCKHVIALGIGITCLLAWREEPPVVVSDFLCDALRDAKQLAKSRTGSFGRVANFYTYGDLLEALQNAPTSRCNKALLSFDLAAKKVTLVKLPQGRGVGGDLDAILPTGTVRAAIVCNSCV